MRTHLLELYGEEVLDRHHKVPPHLVHLPPPTSHPPPTSARLAEWAGMLERGMAGSPV
jgi:hypothetical protein